MRLTTVLLALAGLGGRLGGAPAAAQSPFPAAAAQPPAALDVPFLPQSELLCGGAAVAMVERFWGRRGVYAEDFAALVRRRERGIRTGDLAAAARARGWETRAFDADPDGVRQLLRDSVPVIVLIEVAARRYHYVVLLGWSGGRVTYHDPARGPARTASEAEFLREWSGGARWAMVLRPATTAEPDTAVRLAAPPLPATPLPCSPWLARALDAADADSLDAAGELLRTAERNCPGEPRLLRELAGVRFRQRRLKEAEQLSGAYLALVPDDTLGWQLLAASRYLAGDRDAALAAWNHTGQPVVDLVRITGLRAMRFDVAAHAIGTPPGTVLSPARLRLARRRLDDLPALRRSAVAYRPVEGGRAEVQATVSERAVVDPLWRLLAVNALGALTQREVGLGVATPLGAGELWSARWRWERAHPRVGLRLDVPFARGVVSVESVWERFRFGSDTALAGEERERRHAGGVAYSQWLTPSLRATAGLRLERWSGARDYLAARAESELQAAADHLTLSAAIESGEALTRTPAYRRASVAAQWASSQGLLRPVWTTRAGFEVASTHAPVGAWPVASGDIAWAVPLRAHPRERDGVLPGATIGRAILHGGVTGDAPFYRLGPFTFAGGLFLDGAEILHPADGTGGSRFFLDAGGGLRIGVLDGQLGVLRIDLATGLLDRSTALSVGLHQGWPLFMGRSQLP